MLISDSYKEQQRIMHENPQYGVASVAYAPLVTSVVDRFDIKEVLDYGCGKGRLGQSVEPDHNVKIYQYDPGIEGFDETPEPTEMVCCIDVLEHIEPELLENVLDDLQRVTKEYGLFTVHTGPAVKVLPDGRNAHLTQEDYTWWLPLFWSRFTVITMTQTPNGFYVLCRAIQWQ